MAFCLNWGLVIILTAFFWQNYNSLNDAKILSPEKTAVG